MPLGEFCIVRFNERTHEFGEDMPKKIAKVELNKDQDTLIADWNTAVKQLEEVKSRESQLRTKLVEMLFTATKLEGVETIDLGYGGWRLKATKELNISATNATGQTMSLLDAVGALDPALPANIIKWKPEVSTKGYRDLIVMAQNHPSLNALMAAAITVKPGMPQLELVPPKTAEPAIESNVPSPGEDA